MSQLLPYAETKFGTTIGLDGKVSDEDYSDKENVLDFDIKHTDKTKKVRLKFLFCPENEITPKSEDTDFRKSTKLKHYYPTKKLI